MDKRELKNGSIGGYVLNKNGKKVWRILKGPKKKGGSCKYSLCKTNFFNNICISYDEIYYPNQELVENALLRFLNNKNIVLKVKNSNNCICEGIKKHYHKLNNNQNVKIQRFCNKKGKCGTPYKVNFDDKSFITKKTKIDVKSLTKKGKPLTRYYQGPDGISLIPDDKKFKLYILSNYETQTFNGLNLMNTSNNNPELRKNILQTYDGFICNNYGYNLLEFANNGTLHDFLSKTINDSLKKTFEFIFLQIFETLYKLQDSIDFCHNDLKSINIFMSKDNIIKIADLDRSSSTFEHENNYYRIINRNDICFLAKTHIYKIYSFNHLKYFKLGMFLDATCRLRTNLNNIIFAKSVDLYFCLLNFIQNDYTKKIIFEDNEDIIKPLFCKLTFNNKVKKLSSNEWNVYKNKIYTKLGNFKSTRKFLKLLDYKNIVISINIREIIKPLLHKIKSSFTSFNN